MSGNYFTQLFLLSVMR